jgi:hypothetical protein
MNYCDMIAYNAVGNTLVISMRPTSLTAVALVQTLDNGIYAVWFGLWVYVVKYLTDLIGFPLPYAWIPGGIAAGMLAGHLLRPVRRAGAVAFASEIARSSLKPLMEVGVWLLLRVAYRFWPQDPVTDFVGMGALHRVYDQLPAQRRQQLYSVVCQIEDASNGEMAMAARDFLTEVSDTR